MKGLVLTLLLVLVAAGSWAENTVDAIDGFDWVAMSRLEKARVIEGFWMAEIAIEYQMKRDLLYREDMDDERKAVELLKVEQIFRTPGKVGDVIDEIDRNYAAYKVRDIKLWVVMAVIHHPDWYAGSAPAKANW